MKFKRLVKKPNYLLRSVADKFESGWNFLDLGCGEGFDTDFAKELGLNTTSVDKSKEAKADIYMDVVDFEIEEEKYNVINIMYVLHFLDREKVLEILQKVKNGLRSGGYLIIGAFTIDDDGFKGRPNNGYFKPEELKNIFKDFEIVHYKEKKVLDPGHVGKPEPHHHGIVELVAKK